MMTSSITLPELATKPPTGPPMMAPAELPQVAVLLHQPVRTLPLQTLHQVARRHVWRAGDKEVDVVATDVIFEDLELQLRVDRPNYLSDSVADVTLEDFLPVLGDADQVVLDVEAVVGGPSLESVPYVGSGRVAVMELGVRFRRHKSVEHQLNHGQFDERFRRQDALLPVLAQPPASPQPSERPLDGLIANDKFCLTRLLRMASNFPPFH